MTDIGKSEQGKLRLVSKANDLVEAKYRLTVQEQRLIIIAISKINPMKLEFENPYRLSIDEVAEACEIEKTGIYQKVAATVDKLMTRLVKLKEDDGHRVVHWVSEAKYYTGSGYFELWFHEKMKPYLLDLKEYISYDRKAVLQFQSQYSFRIYEILKKWQGANKRDQFSVKVNELREILGVRKTEYQLFADFKRRVVDKAKVELTQQSDLTFEYDTWKEGRAVAGLIFKIKKNTPTGKPNNKKKGRPKKNKSDQEIHLDSNPSIGELLDQSYSDKMTNNLNSKGIIHHKKYKSEGIQEEHWEQALEEVGHESKAGLVVSSAKKHRDIEQANSKPVAPDYSEINRAYWKQNKHLYKTPASSDEYAITYSADLYSTSRARTEETKQIFFSLEPEIFKNKLKRYIKPDEPEDQRERNIYSLTAKYWTSGQRPTMVLNKINKAQDENLYTKWSTESTRKNKSNPEYIKYFKIGRAYKENQELLHSIFNEVYGDNWEDEAKLKLEAKGIDTNFGPLEN